jgi:hypothetical protein
MRKQAVFGVVVLLAALAGACKGTPSDRDAISASIDRHLQGRSDLNMGVMEHDIKQLSVQGDQATAQVEFRLKQGGGASMLIDYTLARKNGEWVVVRSEPAGGHPSLDQPPPGSPQGGVQGTVPFFKDLLQNSKSSGGNALPPGHPPIGENGSSNKGNGGGAGNSGTPPPGSSY